MHARTDKPRSVYVLFFFVCCVALFATVFLYNNQINKRVAGSVNIRLPFQSIGDRGYIFFTDKNGNELLAASTHFGYNLVISPLQLGDAEETYEHLNEETEIDRDTFLYAASLKNSQYTLIKKNISEKTQKDIQDRIKRYGLKGVWLESFKKRKYVHGSLASHILGFVSVDDKNITRGLYGVEGLYNDVLSNNLTKPGSEHILLEQLGEVKSEIPSRSGNIVLSIDINVQAELERQLQGIQQTWNAKKVGGIIMNPHNGAIIAMASAPTFDPNHFNLVEDYAVFNNPNIQDVYEVGSVFKPLTVAIGLDSGRVNLDTTYHDRGVVEVDDRKLSNHDKRGRGRNTSIQTILSDSLNTGAVFLLNQTTIPIFKDYFDKFRFNDVTRIDLPKEVHGLVDNLETQRDIEFATASYGQGIAITPIGAIRALASLANGGFIVEPYVVSRIQQAQQGGIISGELQGDRERKRVFKRATTDQVTEYLINAYDSALLGGALHNERYSIAAKTGTAQLLDPQTGKYAEGKFFHSFFGYLPAKNPEYIIFLFAVDPEALYAADTLAHPFSNITKHLISYYTLAPDR